jgi:hypothetical protein
MTAQSQIDRHVRTSELRDQTEPIASVIVFSEMVVAGLTITGFTDTAARYAETSRLSNGQNRVSGQEIGRKHAVSVSRPSKNLPCLDLHSCRSAKPRGHGWRYLVGLSE